MGQKEFNCICRLSACGQGLLIKNKDIPVCVALKMMAVSCGSFMTTSYIDGVMEKQIPNMPSGAELSGVDPTPCSEKGAITD